MNRDPLRFDLPDPETIAMMRAKSGAERLKIASGMYASARRMLLAHLRSQHPDWSEPALQAATSRRLALGAG